MLMMEPNDIVTSIFAVIVVYRMLPSESPSLQTLLEAERMAKSTSLRLAVFIVDNTPGGQDPGTLPPGVRYQAEPSNPGLARPYNTALALAEEEGFGWLLTLDQDTHLPPTFLSSLERHAKRYQSVDQVGAVAPRILDNGKPLSPFRFRGGFLPCVLPRGNKGIADRFTSALNSAALLRVTALRQIGGYDLRFPLNNSDTSLFHRLDEAGKRVVVADEILVQHELAILERKDRMSPQRYRQLLIDESDFWDLHMSFLARCERFLRLLGRVFKSFRQKGDAEFRKLTLLEIRRRILTRKSTRMKAKAQMSAPRR